MGLFLFGRETMARKLNEKIQRTLPYKLYYFICEDAQSMQNYINGFKKKYNNRKIVIKSEKAKKGNDAISVQESALDKVNEINEQAIYAGGFKVIACFDKDKNKIKDISDIISQNEETEVMGTIYNNPCYEYWLILHTKPTAKGFTNSEQCCKEAMKEVNSHYTQHFVDLDKFKSAENIFEIIGDDLPQAIKNAKSLQLTDYNSTYTNSHIIFEEIIKEAKE